MNLIFPPKRNVFFFRRFLFLLKVWTLDTDRNLSEKGFLYDIKPYKINVKDK